MRSAGATIVLAIDMAALTAMSARDLAAVAGVAGLIYRAGQALDDCDVALVVDLLVVVREHGAVLAAHESLRVAAQDVAAMAYAMGGDTYAPGGDVRAMV